MTSNLKISVFIPTLNRCEALDECLTSLREQTYDNFEVVVIDGGSRDDPLPVVEKHREHLEILYAVQTGGLIPQANVGWQIATGDIVTRTDDDVRFTPGWLAAIADTFASDPKIGGVTGPTVIPEEFRKGRDLTYFNEKMQQGGWFWSAFAKLYYGFFMEGKPFAVSKFYRSGTFSLGSNFEPCLELEGLQVADHLEACNSSIRRNLIEQAGGYDESYVGIGEYHEPDLAYRVKNLGYQLVFQPKAALYHCPSVQGIFKARPDAFGRSRNFILFYFRHIKPTTFSKAFRFSSYLAFVNCYWFAKFLMTGNLKTLAGIPGTCYGLLENLPELVRPSPARIPAVAGGGS